MLDYIAQFSSWGSAILGFLGIIWGALLTVVPFLPFIALFWLLDVGITSVKEGSFTPVGVAVHTLYGWATQMVQTLVGIGQAIYNFIEFW